MGFLKIGSTEAAQGIADDIRAMATRPLIIKELRPYYRRRQPDGQVKIWFRKEGQHHHSIEMVMAPEGAALLAPNKLVTLRYE